MASSKALIIAAVLVAVILIYTTPEVEGQCGGNIIDAATKCLPFVRKEGPKKRPSKTCCDALKPIDITCACKFLTGNLVKDVSPEKVLYVAKTCRLPIPHGKKCGDYKVPPIGKL